MTLIWRAPELDKRFAIPPGTPLTPGSLLLVNAQAEMLFVRLDEIQRWEVAEEVDLDALVSELGQGMTALVAELATLTGALPQVEGQGASSGEALLSALAGLPETALSELSQALDFDGAEEVDPAQLSAALESVVQGLTGVFDSEDARAFLDQLQTAVQSAASEALDSSGEPAAPDD